jgi:hypothetical protein
MIRIPLVILIAATFVACEKPTADTQEPKKGEPTTGVGDAVQLKDGHGILLHPKLQQSIGVEVAEVTEEKVASEITMDLHVIQGVDSLRRVALTSGGGTEANGWIAEAKARFIKTGQAVDLHVAGGPIEKGVVKRVEKPLYASLGAYEVVVETTALFDTGTRLTATFRSPPGDAVTAIPRAALLKTAEGSFVYTINESFYLRTPVTIGAMNADFVEITDGLYAGDQIVTAPVNTLWMAELQLLRGGKACTCGH